MVRMVFEDSEVWVEEDGIYYDADPRHIDLIAESLNITAANSVCSPGVKNPDPDSEPDLKVDNDSGVSMVDGDSKVKSLSCASADCGWGDARNLPELLCAITGDSPKLSRQ